LRSGPTFHHDGTQLFHDGQSLHVALLMSVYVARW
jgi:hypothetical protein